MRNYTITFGERHTDQSGKKGLDITAADKQKKYLDRRSGIHLYSNWLYKGTGDGTSILTGVLNVKVAKGWGTYSILQGSLDAAKQTLYAGCIPAWCWR